VFSFGKLVGDLPVAISVTFHFIGYVEPAFQVYYEIEKKNSKFKILFFIQRGV